MSQNFFPSIGGAWHILSNDHHDTSVLFLHYFFPAGSESSAFTELICCITSISRTAIATYAVHDAYSIAQTTQRLVKQYKKGKLRTAISCIPFSFLLR
jgi:hypothetical protein